MKKVLFATTALIATAGVASAEVAVSGWAEMGISKTNSTDAVLFQDYNVKFSMSGTTDGGLSFGANVELRDIANGGYKGTGDDNGTDVYIKGGFGSLTMGNTDGAMDWAMSEVGIAGSIADNNTAHAGYMGSYGDGAYDGQIVRYDNSFGDIGFAVSTEIDDSGARANGFALGAKYGMDMGGTTVNLGAGYQTYVVGTTAASGWKAAAGWTAGDKITIAGISANANFGGMIAKIEYTQLNNNNNANVTHTGVGLGYSANGLTLGANYGTYQVPGANNDSRGFGIAADYDLGGGAVVQAGYGTSTVGSAASTNDMSIGLRLNF